LFNIPIEYLGFPIKIFNSSKRIGITSIGDLIELLRVGGPLEARNFGEATINEIEQKLREYGYWSFPEASTKQPHQNPSPCSD
jgi:DNA-directed RNA polymerase subunit alpha